MFKRRRKEAARNGLPALIDEGSAVGGQYTFSGTVMLNGRFKGEISTTDMLIIGDKGVINGDIRAGQVLVSGEVVGNVSAAERIELKRTARVFGDVEAPVVVVEEGVLFEGHCRMTKVNPNTEAIPTRALAAVPIER